MVGGAFDPRPHSGCCVSGSFAASLKPRA